MLNGQVELIRAKNKTMYWNVFIIMKIMKRKNKGLRFCFELIDRSYGTIVGNIMT